MSERSLWINSEGEAVHPNAPQGAGGPGRFRNAGSLGSDVELYDEVPHPFSSAGRKHVLDEEDREQLEGGDSPPPAQGEETPTFTSTTGVPVDVLADTVNEFVNKSNAAMGDGDQVGHMQPDVSYNAETDGQGRVTKVNMVVNTKIVRPRWAGGRAKGKEEELIKKAVTLIKEHEERHRDIAKDFMTQACRAMRGKTGAKADATLTEFIKKMNTAQDALDAKEGHLHVEHNGPAGTAGPATDVKLGPR